MLADVRHLDVLGSLRLAGDAEEKVENEGCYNLSVRQCALIDRIDLVEEDWKSIFASLSDVTNGSIGHVH